ncbi:hypothetical protein ACOKW7_08690, partial [Limnospira platensis CENA597]|uniref:hypothetical protein n=1 Tax=Limnospira platensis TaxID=118562 RepID=UPI003DA1BFC3
MVRDRRTIRDKPKITIRDKPKIRPRSGVRYDTAPFRLNDDPGKLGDPFRGWTGDPYGRELNTRNNFISDSEYVAPKYWDADEYHKKREAEKAEEEAEEREKRKDIKKEATVKEPPNRDEPKGGKKPRGKGGAGRGFGGPNSGDEVDDDKGRSSDNQGDNASYLNELIEETTAVKDDCYYLLPYALPLYGESSGYRPYRWFVGDYDRFEKNDFQTSLDKSNDGVSFTFQASYEYSKVYRDGRYPPTFINNSWSGRMALLPRRWRRETEIIIWESMTSHNVICEFEELSPGNLAEGDYIEGGNLNERFYLAAIYIRGKYLQTFLSLHTNPFDSMAFTTYWFLPGNRVTSDRKTFDYKWSFRRNGIYGRKNRYYTFKHSLLSATERAFWGFGIFPCTLQWLNYNTWLGLYVYDPICEIEYTRRKRVKITIPDMNEECCCGMIRRIYEFLDPESFPAEMPEKITVNADNPENRIKRINTLPEWLMYRFDIDDERWGEFEVKVEIDDVNLMTKEQEHAEIKLPNLAEAIAEIFGMVMEIAISHQVTQNAVLTCLHETGLAHAAAFKAGREVSEILDYLGFETEEKYEKLKTAFTPEAESFEELLEPNESKVKITNQKNAKETLQTALNQIKEIFSIVRAQGTLQVNGNDPSKDILADLTRLYDSMKK